MSEITPSQTVGPYFAYGLTPKGRCQWDPNGQYAWKETVGDNLVTPDATGEKIRIDGRVTDGDGQPINDAMIEIWQADGQGRYAAAAGGARPNTQFKGFGRSATNKDGEYGFATVKPGVVPGPKGTTQAPHILVAVYSRGMLRQVYTRIYFADEAGIRSDYHSGTTWAPVGRTPVVRGTGARYSVNMLSAVSAQGALRFMVHDGTVNAKVFVDFCKRLLTDAKGPVYLIVDGHPSHRAKAVAEFVASTDGRLRLFFLPGYSPELNPDEWVWKNVKHDRIGKIGVTTKDDLKTKATNALRRLQKLPALVRSFFHDPNLSYITA